MYLARAIVKCRHRQRGSKARTHHELNLHLSYPHGTQLSPNRGLYTRAPINP